MKKVFALILLLCSVCLIGCYKGNAQSNTPETSVSLRVKPEAYEEYKAAADQLKLPLRQLFLQVADEFIENHLKKV